MKNPSFVRNVKSSLRDGKNPWISFEIPITSRHQVMIRDKFSDDPSFN